MNNKKIINIIILLFLVITSCFINEQNKFNKQYESAQLSTNTASVSPKKLFTDCWRIIKTRYYDSSMNEQNWYYWKNHYAKHVKTEEDAYMAINTMIASLNDPYSKFMTPGEFQEQNIDMDAKVTGIGVNITTISGKFLIIGVIEDSPAEKNGLKIGDIILKVDNTDVSGKNISDIANTIRGPIDSYVVLDILRSDKKFSKKLQRKEVKLQSVRAKIINDEIGYIKINNFMSTRMLKEFDEALKKVSGTKGLIIDLRNNPGGVLENAVMLTNIFVNSGAIVNIHFRTGQEEPIMANTEIPTLSIPAVVLVNNGSASASEIFCGALKDHERAVLVGETTYGKGMIQKVYSLPNKTGMNITVAKYLTPNGTDINKHGVEPHYEIKNDETKITFGKDSQLNKAISVLKSLIAKQ